MFDRSATHSVLARENHDDRARTQFIVGLKRGLRTLSAGNTAAYNRNVLPQLKSVLDREPVTIDEIDTVMQTYPYYRLWSTLSRTAQDMMWDAVETVVLHDMPRMLAAAETAASVRKAGGSLTLDPGVDVPADVLIADIHCQPGGYMRDGGASDLTAGALYESGGNVYSLGAGIGSRDSKAAAIIRFFNERFVKIRPLRILDLGCSAGGASVAYAGGFPEAEIHAVDVGPSMLRYAHARAEALGVAVHFHQMNAAALGFPDGSFDLVVSHNVMHEVSSETLKSIFAESYRVLRAGGVAIHQDVPIQYRNASLFERFMFSWETRFNNEPFWEVFAQSDARAMMAAAGFPGTTVGEDLVPKLDGPGHWYVVYGQKSAEV